MARLIMASPGALDLPELREVGPVYAKWLVTVFNNETNTYDEVITVLMLATGCDVDEAWMETWEVDHLGKSVVHLADEEECHEVAKIIAKIGIRTEVSES